MNERLNLSTKYVLDQKETIIIYEVPPGRGRVIYSDGRAIDFTTESDPKIVKVVRKGGTVCVGNQIEGE